MWYNKELTKKLQSLICTKKLQYFANIKTILKNNPLHQIKRQILSKWEFTEFYYLFIYFCHN